MENIHGGDADEDVNGARAYRLKAKPRFRLVFFAASWTYMQTLAAPEEHGGQFLDMQAGVLARPRQLVLGGTRVGRKQGPG